MKIRIVLCSKDMDYSNRLKLYFQTHYYDKYSWNVFENIVDMFDHLNMNSADVVLVDSTNIFEISEEQRKRFKDIVWGVFVNYKGEIANNNDIKLDLSNIYEIEKFKRADYIERNIMKVYTTKPDAHYNFGNSSNASTSIYSFISSNGGTGSSTIATAMAEYYARTEKVLYLNLEDYNASDMVFNNEDFIFDDLLIALKMKGDYGDKLKMMISTMINRSDNGVFYFSGMEKVLGIQELNKEDIETLFNCLIDLQEYDKVIVDLNNGLKDRELAVLSLSNKNIIVIEDEEICFNKLNKFTKALVELERIHDINLLSKTSVVYNKTFKDQNYDSELMGMRVIGSFPRIVNGSYSEKIHKLSNMELFKNIK